MVVNNSIFKESHMARVTVREGKAFFDCFTSDKGEKYLESISEVLYMAENFHVKFKKLHEYSVLATECLHTLCESLYDYQGSFLIEEESYPIFEQ